MRSTRYILGRSNTQAHAVTAYFHYAQVSLVDTSWTLVSYGPPANQQAVPSTVTITATFGADGQLFGSAGCNSYTSTYQVNEQALVVQPPASTRMMCPSGMEAEAAYLAALPGATSYQIVGQILTVSLSDGQVLTYTSASLPLETTLWALVSVDDQPIPVESSLTAFFKPDPDIGKNELSGFAGCNQFSGSYKVDGQDLSISDLASTMMMCSEEVMQVEQAYLKALESSTSYTINGASLRISTVDGILKFTASRTPLTGALWILQAYGDVQNPVTPVTGSNFTAQFTRSPLAPTGIVSGTTGCNEYAAAFTSSLTEIKINLPVSTGVTSCAPGLVDEEQLFFLALQDAREYRILGASLVIPYDSGRQALVFTATQIGTARFQPLSALDGTQWYLWSINNQPTIPGTVISADFTIQQDQIAGTIQGTAGCSLYQAVFGDGVAVQTTLNSQTVCTQPEGIMDQEDQYLQTLGTVRRFKLVDGRLQLLDLGGQTVLTYTPLEK